MMGDVTALWLLAIISIVLLGMLVWLIAGAGLRRWWQRIARCPRGLHSYEFTGERKIKPMRRLCETCGAEDVAYSIRREYEERPQPEAVIVGVRGWWGREVGYE